MDITLLQLLIGQAVFRNLESLLAKAVRQVGCDRHIKTHLCQLFCLRKYILLPFPAS